MRFPNRFPALLLPVGILLTALVSLHAQEEKEPASSTDTQVRGMPARVAPTEYQTHAQAGSVTIGADFVGHSVPTPEHIFSSEDFIVVEAAFFGPPGARINLSRDDFSLRVNGKKTTLASEPFELVSRSLKDPEWVPPESPDSKQSKSSLSTGGNGQNDSAPPPPPKMPFPLKRAMEQQVQKAMMESGDRPLPQAGLLFFQYRGKAEGIHSLELSYSGAAGKATWELQP